MVPRTSGDFHIQGLPGLALSAFEKNWGQVENGLCNVINLISLNLDCLVSVQCTNH